MKWLWLLASMSWGGLAVLAAANGKELGAAFDVGLSVLYFGFFVNSALYDALEK